MSFPVIVGITTFNESQFSGLGYSAAFLQLIEALANQSIKPPTASSTTSLTLGIGVMVLTVENGRLFQTGDHVRAFNSLAGFMEGTVVSYVDGAGEAEPFENLTVDFTKFTGTGTFSSWEIVPTGLTECPTPLSRGGSPSIGGLTGLPAALGMQTKQNVAVCESNFLCGLPETDPYPFYKEVLTGGTVQSGGNVAGGISGAYAGAVLLNTPSPGDKAFLSYGNKGFLYLGDGGDLQFNCRAFPPTAEGAVMRLGFMVDADSNLSDQFQGFGFGFEVQYQDGNYQVAAVVNDGTSIFKSRVSTLFAVEGREPSSFCIRFCASDGNVTLGTDMEQVRNPYDYPYTAEYLQVNVKPFYTRLNSGAALKRAGLLRPFFFAENLSAEALTAGFALDSFVVTRYIRRG